MDFFDPKFLEALSRLGVVAFFVAITLLWLRRIIITRTEMTERDLMYEKRLAEKDETIAFMRGLTTGLTRRLDRFQIVLERLTGVKVPADPDAQD